MDNCAHNGEKVETAVLTIARAWLANGFVNQEFLDYLQDRTRITFPWTMIDKITPGPSLAMQESLTQIGLEDMAPVATKPGSRVAPFVNAEAPEYLVVEDDFPNGRPPLEKAGVYLCQRDTVNKCEKMKVTTCLNPLHTAMSVYGCLLGHTLICKEMDDGDMVALIRRLGYQEGLPVVVHPGILNPKAFLDEVVDVRLPNPFLPDDPGRIASDTSQKMAIRFGETIKSYVAQGRDMGTLVAIPLAIAGWLRYLLAVDDFGNAMPCAPDPMLETLQRQLSGIQVGNPASYTGQLRNILSNETLFGVDLVSVGLAETIEGFFVEQLAGPGAVRTTLQRHLS